MSDLLGTPEKYWKKVYERRFLELAYRVMEKAEIDSVLIDAFPVGQMPVIATQTESAHGVTILIERFPAQCAEATIRRDEKEREAINRSEHMQAHSFDWGA